MIVIRDEQLPPGLAALATVDEHRDLIITLAEGLAPERRRAVACMAKRATRGEGWEPGLAAVASPAASAGRGGWLRATATAVAGAVGVSVLAVFAFLAPATAHAPSPAGTYQMAPRPHMHRRRQSLSSEAVRVHPGVASRAA